MGIDTRHYDKKGRFNLYELEQNYNSKAPDLSRNHKLSVESLLGSTASAMP